jgi:hypothetical protein
MAVIPEATASGDILRNHQGPLHFRFYLETNSGRLAKYTLQDSAVTWGPRDGMQRKKSSPDGLKEQYDVEGMGIGHRMDDEGRDGGRLFVAADISDYLIESVLSPSASGKHPRQIIKTRASLASSLARIVS